MKYLFLIFIAGCATVEPEGWDSMPTSDCRSGIICTDGVDCYESEYFYAYDEELVCERE